MGGGVRAPGPAAGPVHTGCQSELSTLLRGLTFFTQGFKFPALSLLATAKGEHPAPFLLAGQLSEGQETEGGWEGGQIGSEQAVARDLLHHLDR